MKVRVEVIGEVGIEDYQEEPKLVGVLGDFGKMYHIGKNKDHGAIGFCVIGGVKTPLVFLNVYMKFVPGWQNPE